MAKNKVINTVLTLKDEMSGGLVAAAKAAKKSGKNIDDSMMQATRKVVAFKNKSLTALGDFAKKGVKAAGAAVAGMTAAFIALDGATEEYRVAQGKLNAGFQAAGFSADVARKSYRNFYAILGDADTATEASQLLANMAKNEEEVTKWTRIAAGVHGTFGDSLPIEGLVESANETARTGKVTGVFADALNWVGIMEDDFNAKLEQTTDVSKRNQLIMDTLSKTYDKAADSFYANNQQVINARRNHATLDEMLAKVGDTSSKLKNQLWVLAGAAEDGSIRSGSMLDWVQRKAEAFGQWIEGLDLSSLQKQFDEQFARALQKAGEALQWVRDNSDTLIGTLKKLAVAWGVGKMLAFVAGAITTIQTISGFLKTLKLLVALKSTEIYCWVRSAVVVGANTTALIANKAVGGLRWIVGSIATLMTNAVEWSVNTACIIANKAALIAHKAVGGVVWLVQQAAALGVASAAWIHNTAMMVVNKAGMVASAVASGVATGATAALTAAQWALNAAFVATPIGWIVLGLAAVVAAGVALYKNWDTVKAKAGEVWNSIKTAFGGIRDSITGAFSAAKEKVAGFFSWLNQKIESVPILGSIYKGGKNAVSWIADRLDGNAMGTPYWRGGYTRVNERGGEIMNLPSGTQIIPHDVSVKAAGGRSVTVNVTIQGNVIGNREYTEQVGEYVGRKVLAALGNT
ncbi:hypothetical protein DXB06_12245 [Butyricicoccus sp. OF13-6]|jgi:hypothetical protein|nr:hypothetical protein [Butyricicoccus sp. OF13-6]RHV72582.1 hypothetical protein DXB06_12245 [Butyricicoccus sp. OF13-6]